MVVVIVVVLAEVVIGSLFTLVEALRDEVSASAAIDRPGPSAEVLLHGVSAVRCNSN